MTCASSGHVGTLIPVTEKLPEENVIVSCVEKDTLKIYRGWYLNIEGLGIKWFDDKGFSMNVVAWIQENK